MSVKWRQQVRAYAPSVLWLLAVSVADVITSRRAYLSPLLVIAAPIAALRVRPWGVVAVGAVSLTLRIFLAAHDGLISWEGTSDDRTVFVGQIVGFVAIASFAVYIAYEYQRRLQALATMTSIADTAQRALLADPPAEVGRLAIAVRYRSAAEEARIGGDLYAVADTPHGVRVIIGDVRGKGLSAVQHAAAVLGTFRDAAYEESDLDALARRLEQSAARQLPEGEFVTALLVHYSENDNAVELLHYGHVAPLLVREPLPTGTLEPGVPGLPLGLTSLVASPPAPADPPAPHPPPRWRVPIRTGDVLVLCTDGVVETRNRAGDFYPLARRISTLTELARLAEPGSGPTSPASPSVLHRVVDLVFADLEHFSGAAPSDDAVLLLIGFRGAEAEPVPVGPAP